MTDHTRAALLQAIIDDPADDLPRLAYADYLEENGHDAHAEFIRAQLLLAKTKSECGSESGDYLCRSMTCPMCPLIRRQHAAWFDMPLDYISRTYNPSLVFAYTIFAGPTHPPPVVHIRRGFVESVQCTHYQWLEHGPTIARANPVERVTLMNKDASMVYRTFSSNMQILDGVYYRFTSDNGYFASHAPTSYISKYICDHLSVKRCHSPEGAFDYWYNSHQEAIDDLNRAAIAWARSEACKATHPSSV